MNLWNASRRLNLMISRYGCTLNNFGANDCLVIEPSKNSVDNQERLIPFIKDIFIKSIDDKKVNRSRMA